MALVVQDDDGSVAGANGYIDLEFFQSYCEDRRLNLDSYEEDAQTAGIIVSTAYIDSDKWQGVRLNEDQETEFPRACLYDRSGKLVEGLFRQLKQACAEYTYQYLVNGGKLYLTPQVGANGLIAVSETRKLGPIEKTTSYMAGSQATRIPYPNADRLLAEFRKSVGQRVIR